MNLSDILNAARKIGNYMPMVEAATGAAKAGAEYGKRLARGERLSPVAYALEPSKVASDKSEAAFPEQASGNTQRDAMRHMLWMAETGNSFGRPIARLIGGANELIGALHGQPLSEMAMDLRNNEFGLDLADMAAPERLRRARELAEGSALPEPGFWGGLKQMLSPSGRATKLR